MSRPEMLGHVDGDRPSDHTPDEPWMLERPDQHHYCMETDFAHHHLGNGKGKMLIVGSPLFEAIEFSKAGWDVTYVDVRVPPPLPFKVLQGDICTMELEPASFDAVSSTCVLCHVGMGRYGDPIVEDADEKALNNIGRALKPGCLAAITFGPIADIPYPVRLDTTHRIYNMPTILVMVANAGFYGLRIGILNGNSCEWVSALPVTDEEMVLDRYIVSTILIKHA